MIKRAVAFCARVFHKVPRYYPLFSVLTKPLLFYLIIVFIVPISLNVC